MSQDRTAEALRSALVAKGTNEASKLLFRMDRCGQETEWNGYFTCRTPACRACRWRYIKKQRSDAVKRLADADVASLGMASIVIGGVSSVNDIGPLFKTFAKDLRNLIDARRRGSKRWADVELTLWLETDAMSGSDLPLVGSDKLAQFSELWPIFFHADQPVWIVTVHGLVCAGEVGLEEVRRALAERWPAHKQTHVSSLHRHLTKANNIKRIVGYSNKHLCRTALGAVREDWPPDWRATYYTWLNGWSKSFQSMRISIGPKVPKRLSVDEIDISDEIEPMPHTSTFSIFPTYY